MPGFKKLWGIFLKTEDEDLEQNLIIFLAKIYSEPEYNFNINKELFLKEK